MPWFPHTFVGWILLVLSVVALAFTLYYVYDVMVTQPAMRRFQQMRDVFLGGPEYVAMPPSDEVELLQLPDTAAEDWDRAFAEHLRNKRRAEGAVIYVHPNQYIALKTRLEQEGYEVRVQHISIDYTG